MVPNRSQVLNKADSKGRACFAVWGGNGEFSSPLISDWRILFVPGLFCIFKQHIVYGLSYWILWDSMYMGFMFFIFMVWEVTN